MYSFKKSISYYFILVSLIACSISIAKEDLSALEFEHKIYKDPYLTYQHILKNTTTVNSEDYMWWLLRKAQCEYLLYFYEDFEKTINTSYKLLKEDAPAMITAYVNFYQGIIIRDKGEYKKSSAYFDLVLKVSKKAGLNYIYIQAKHEKAYTQSLAELFEISLLDMQEAYVKAQELDNQFLMASIHETYGAIYGYMHDYEKSIEYYEKALKSYRKLDYKAHIAEAIYGIASTYRYWKKYDQAIDYFKKYREVSEYTPNEEISFFAAYGLGMTLSEQGSCKQAITIIDQALQKQGVIDYNSELYKNKAICMVKLGRINEAVEAIENAKTIFKQLPDLAETSWQFETIKIESQIALAKGEYQLSYKLLEEYYEKYTSLLIKNSSDRLLTVRTQLEQNRREIEEDLERQRNQVVSLKQKTLEQSHNQQMYFLLFIITIIVVIAILQQRSNKKMHKLSMTDPLSGLFNRRYVFGFIDKLLASMSPEKGRLSLILFDLDDFKKVNDQYGHPAGDFVIKKIAEIGEKVLRSSDVLARIGGEEFLCVLPRASKSQALEVAERLLNSVSECDFNYVDTKGIKVTISIGIASYSQSSQSYNEIYTLADKALYMAKSQGKNCIQVSET